MSPLRVLLISTYDLGRQPFGIASPAAWLAEIGARVTCLDLAVEGLDPAAVREADLIAVYVPMHTATRLAARCIPSLRALNDRAHLCVYGLYAAMNEAHLRSLGAQTVVSGEFEGELLRLAERLGRRGGGADVAHPDGTARVTLDRLDWRIPDRAGLPPLERYARLRLPGGETLVAGATEASRGCKHRCRHCPIVPVYGGRFRVVDRDVVLADVRRQVARGARHITFGDPDFWNGIGHAMPIVRALHAEHPEVGYDATIKVEHLLRHAEHLPELVRTGCRFVTTAVESFDDSVLARLDKGHTRADFERALAECRRVGLALQPTFVAFHPWMDAPGYRAFLETLAALGLVEHVAPVQYAIRLLVPAGSTLLEDVGVRALVGAFDPAALVHPWRHPDPAVDRLQRELQDLVAGEDARGASRPEIFGRVCAAAGAIEASPRPGLDAPRAPIPYMTEPWYC